MNPKIGTCSWKFDSWAGLVYSRSCATAAQCLREYSGKFRTAEIDSWFYRLPDEDTVNSYLANVDGEFRFTCKIPSAISLTHFRNRDKTKELVPNPDFLSKDLFTTFLEVVEPMAGRIDAMMLQFEYLNRRKMPSLDHFLEALDRFTEGLPEGVPMAIETRNKNYLKSAYFEFLKEKGLMHVFSEKLYMPHVYDVYEEFGGEIEGGAVIRLLGGDRKEIEDKTGKSWDRIVEPRADLGRIADIALDMVKREIDVTVNVNNHYEGSAPLTIEKLLGLLDG
jgi:uncharacterized protein YecE (DUF72 family)